MSLRPPTLDDAGQLPPLGSASSRPATDYRTSLADSFAQIQIRANRRPFRIIPDAHKDDVHGLTRLAGCFVSGSKDGTLKIWTDQGEQVKTVQPEKRRGYEYWITALTSLGDTKWASGTRDGRIAIGDTGGRIISTFAYKPSKRAQEQYVCKGRNRVRINCIAFAGNMMVYTGTPKYVQKWDGGIGNMMCYWQADPNDWVYCIESLAERVCLVAIGARLERWNMSSTQQPERKTLIAEPSQAKGQRPFISALARLDHNPNLTAAACFDGAVRVVDLETGKIVCTYQHVPSSHRDTRVWAVINGAPQEMITSGEDAQIKLWDVRQQQRPIAALGGNPGRVSALLRLTPEVFISSACPKDPFHSRDKAVIAFWDRRLVS